MGTSKRSSSYRKVGDDELLDGMHPGDREGPFELRYCNGEVVYAVFDIDSRNREAIV